MNQNIFTTPFQSLYSNQKNNKNINKFNQTSKLIINQNNNRNTYNIAQINPFQTNDQTLIFQNQHFDEQPNQNKPIQRINDDEWYYLKVNEKLRQNLPKKPLQTQSYNTSSKLLFYPQNQFNQPNKPTNNLQFQNFQLKRNNSPNAGENIFFEPNQVMTLNEQRLIEKNKKYNESLELLSFDQKKRGVLFSEQVDEQPVAVVRLVETGEQINIPKQNFGLLQNIIEKNKGGKIQENIFTNTYFDKSTLMKFQKNEINVRKTYNLTAKYDQNQRFMQIQTNDFPNIENALKSDQKQSEKIDFLSLFEENRTNISQQNHLNLQPIQQLSKLFTQKQEVEVQIKINVNNITNKQQFQLKNFSKTVILTHTVHQLQTQLFELVKNQVWHNKIEYLTNIKVLSITNNIEKRLQPTNYELQIFQINAQSTLQIDYFYSEGPILDKEEFQTQPDIEQLAYYSENELKQVENFIIQNSFGEIQFIKPVDLHLLDLGKLICIKQKFVNIYPQNKNGFKLFELGEKINQEAIVTIYCIDLDLFEQVKIKRGMDLSGLEKKLKRQCEKQKAEFLGLNWENLNFYFKVFDWNK